MTQVKPMKDCRYLDHITDVCKINGDMCEYYGCFEECPKADPPDD